MEHTLAELLLRFTYPAMYPDGTLMLTHESPSKLYDMTGTVVPSNGLATISDLYDLFAFA